jgi:putative intracellular protease/amidase
MHSDGPRWLQWAAAALAATGVAAAAALFLPGGLDLD